MSQEEIPRYARDDSGRININIVAMVAPLLPLSQPSARNVAWLKANPWLEGDMLPTLRERVHEVPEGAPFP